MKPDKGPIKDEEQDKENLPGYPHYPGNEDIYRQEKEEADIDPETGLKKNNPRHLEEASMDIPGADPIDMGVFAEDDMAGREDEENDYYSLGGDNHEDLEDHRDDFDANREEE